MRRVDTSDATETEPRRLYTPVSDTPQTYLREPEGTHPPLDYPPYKSTALRHPSQPLVYLPQSITEITGPALQTSLDIGPA